jgi:protein PET100
MLTRLQFGIYIMFPIAIMYYYGTNLDNRFSVPDFWPKPEQTNRIPFEKDEIHSELERLRQRRLYLRDKRLEQERASDSRNNGSVNENR